MRQEPAGFQGDLTWFWFWSSVDWIDPPYNMCKLWAERSATQSASGCQPFGGRDRERGGKKGEISFSAFIRQTMTGRWQPESKVWRRYRLPWQRVTKSEQPDLPEHQKQNNTREGLTPRIRPEQTRIHSPDTQVSVPQFTDSLKKPTDKLLNTPGNRKPAKKQSREVGHIQSVLKSRTRPVTKHFLNFIYLVSGLVWGGRPSNCILGVVSIGFGLWWFCLQVKGACGLTCSSARAYSTAQVEPLPGLSSKAADTARAPEHVGGCIDV